MLAFAAAVFFLIVTPGPGVLSTAGVGASYGARPGLSYVGGLFIGTNMVALAVVSGLAALLLGDPVLRVALGAASTLYLLYLAAKIAFAGARIAFIHPEQPPGLRDGVLLQLINPKAYAVNTVMFSNFPLGLAFGTEMAAKFLIMNAVWIPLHLLWLGAGVALRRMSLSARAQRRINYAMAMSMLLVVGLTIWKADFAQLAL
ncbi:LysE family translocator [Oceanibium sediminis]|uniref:LysE family translocator n=1 Tax=Oceanibium sediminis TaxID=2026339 RepID=UPI000DD4367A|nr:LysE family translocator [Oceanibium sediminis]